MTNERAWGFGVCNESLPLKKQYSQIKSNWMREHADQQSRTASIGESYFRQLVGKDVWQDAEDDLINQVGSIEAQQRGTRTTLSGSPYRNHRGADWVDHYMLLNCLSSGIELRNLCSHGVIDKPALVVAELASLVRSLARLPKLQAARTWLELGQAHGYRSCLGIGPFVQLDRDPSEDRAVAAKLNEQSGMSNRGPSFADEMAWLARNRAQYSGEWVALAGGRLVSHGHDVASVYSEATKAGVNVPFIAFIRKENEPEFAGW